MLDHTALFTYVDHVDPRRVRANTLVITLSSFIDAGHAQRLLDGHLLNSLSSHQLGTFDADQLTSYRDQRPSIVFSFDHFEQYRAPELALHEIKDADGTAFLLLTGPEPGLQWERMAAAVAGIIERHDVTTTIMASSMPMAIPHTREGSLTRWASRAELIDGNAPMFGRVQMSASFPAMLAVRLADRGHDVVGLTAHVPHYLADNAFPATAVRLLSEITAHSGLQLSPEALVLAAERVRGQIDQQVAESDELTEHVADLERAYDELQQRRQVAVAEESLPSADELGQAAEAFLKNLGGDGSDGSWSAPNAEG